MGGKARKSQDRAAVAEGGLRRRAPRAVVGDSLRAHFSRHLPFLFLACSLFVLTSCKALPNFGTVEKGFYRGAQPTKAGYAELKKIGVKTVINFRTGSPASDDRQLAEKYGMDYVALPWKARQGCTDEMLQKFLKIAQDPALRPIFVHCRRGKDRTGFMVAAYRIRVDHWSVEKAFEEMEGYGHKQWEFKNLKRDLERFAQIEAKAA